MSCVRQFPFNYKYCPRLEAWPVILSYRSLSFKQKLMLLTRTKRRRKRILKPSCCSGVGLIILDVMNIEFELDFFCRSHRAPQLTGVLLDAFPELANFIEGAFNFSQKAPYCYPLIRIGEEDAAQSIHKLFDLLYEHREIICRSDAKTLSIACFSFEPMSEISFTIGTEMLRKLQKLQTEIEMCVYPPRFPRARYGKNIKGYQCVGVFPACSPKKNDVKESIRRSILKNWGIKLQSQISVGAPNYTEDLLLSVERLIEHEKKIVIATHYGDIFHIDTPLSPEILKQLASQSCSLQFIYDLSCKGRRVNIEV